MTIEEYIESKEKFHLMPFVAIYTAIMEPINDGIIAESTFKNGGESNVETSKPKSEWEERRRLYDSRYFFSNR